jgi:tetratricopeptide (TPR) repeat protein
MRAGRFADVHRYFGESQQLFQSAGETGGVADAMRFDADATSAQGDFEKAAAGLDSALALSTRIGYIRLTTEIQLLQVYAWRRLGKLPEAAAAAEAGLRSAQEAGNLDATSRAFNSIGLVTKSQGQYARARDMFTESARAARGLSVQGDYTTSMSNLAVLDVMEGQLSDARAKLEEILPIDRKLGRPYYTASRLYTLSRVRFQQGDVDDAQKLNTEECGICLGS